MFRGAPLTDKEKLKLNIRGQDILRKTGVEYSGQDYDTLRKTRGWAGFASYYVGKSWDESKLANKADIDIYKELITIDEKLRTKMTEQVQICVKYSYRKDLLKV